MYVQYPTERYFHLVCQICTAQCHNTYCTKIQYYEYSGSLLPTVNRYFSSVKSLNETQNAPTSYLRRLVSNFLIVSCLLRDDSCSSSNLMCCLSLSIHMICSTLTTFQLSICVHCYLHVRSMYMYLVNSYQRQTIKSLTAFNTCSFFIICNFHHCNFHNEFSDRLS